MPCSRFGIDTEIVEHLGARVELRSARLAGSAASFLSVVRKFIIAIAATAALGAALSLTATFAARWRHPRPPPGRRDPRPQQNEDVKIRQRPQHS
jgi:hypothetical protein